MGVLSVVLLVLFVIVSLLLIFLVAIQDEKSEGLGGIFGGSSDTAFRSYTSGVVTKASGVSAILKSFSVALLTPLSVDCADSTTATSSV